MKKELLAAGLPRADDSNIVELPEESDEKQVAEKVGLEPTDP